VSGAVGRLGLAAVLLNVWLLLLHCTTARVTLPSCRWSPCNSGAGQPGCLLARWMALPLMQVPFRLPASA
jgi:hypothetical protein